MVVHVAAGELDSTRLPIGATAIGREPKLVGGLFRATEELAKRLELLELDYDNIELAAERTGRQAL